MDYLSRWALYPLVVQDQIIFRNPHGIQAIDAKTGTPLWKFPCETSLAKLMEQPSRGGREKPDLDRVLAGNPSWGMLASDGRRVFAIDQLEMTWNPISVVGGKVVSDPSRERRKSNRLIALDLQSQGDVEKPIWSLGGPNQPNNESFSLAGHFFLGPPLPLHDRLYTVAEHEHQLHLMALHAQTGELIWSQGIALVDLSIENDRNRYSLACTPSYANGILICPTQLGVVVAVDETTGTLLWVHYYGDPLPKNRFGRMPYRQHNVYGHSGYPDVPLISSDRVVTMPRQSKFIHCLGLADGNRRWRIPRDDGEYVATIDGKTVLIVGRYNCRGLSLEDGSQLWSARLGMSVGRGVQVGDTYVLPLANGSVANIDIATGRQIGFTRTTVDTHIGNLVLHEGAIYSLSGDQLSAFDQAGPILDKLQPKIAQQLATAPEMLQAGELELILGRLQPAKQFLSSALLGNLPENLTVEAESLLRETLYLQIQPASTEEEQLLAELEILAQKPQHRARYLILKAEFELRRAAYIAAVEAAIEFANLDVKRPISLSSRGAYAVTAGSWVPSFLAQVSKQADPESAELIELMIDRQLSAVMQQRHIPELKQFLASFSMFPQADVVRLALADSYADRGESQAAEFLLLTCRKADDPYIAGAATWALAELYAGRHVHTRSRSMLRELLEKYGDYELSHGATGRELVAEFAARNLEAAPEASQQKSVVKITSISIAENRWPQIELEKVYANFWHPLKVPDDCEFDLRPTGNRRPSNDLWQVHRKLGIPLGILKLPNGYEPPSTGSVQQSFSGHFFTVGSKSGGVMYGISLLEPAQDVDTTHTAPPEKQMLWTTVAPGMSEHTGNMIPGPAGLGFCSFQSSQQLFVLDPANGKIRWRRGDIQPGGGKFTDRNVGLFGDEQVLVNFGPDKQTFTVYETATGQELKQGRLDVELSHQRHLIGRNLLHVVNENGRRWLRLWDPLTDEFLFNEPLLTEYRSTKRSNPLVQPVKFSQNFAFLSQDVGGVRIIDGKTGEIELDIPLTKTELSNLKALAVFQDQERVYVNLQKDFQGIWHANSFAGETFLPNVRISGEMRVYDRQTGKHLWTRHIPQCVIPHIQDFEEPVLVTLSRVSWRGRYFLQVAAYHAQTGELLGSKRNIISHRIVQAAYDPAARELILRSLKSKLTLKLHQRPVLDGGGELRTAELPLMLAPAQ